jgi:hypothetical protein
MSEYRITIKHQDGSTRIVYVYASTPKSAREQAERIVGILPQYFRIADVRKERHDSTRYDGVRHDVKG